MAAVAVGGSLVGLSPEEFHNNVAETVQKAAQRPFPQVEVRYRDLSISADLFAGKRHKRGVLPERKVILNNISGVFKPGTITLILGQPGSGKSSLLKLLSGRFPVAKSVKITGEITYNGRTRQDLFARLPLLIGYVDQHDRHLPMLTVEETFHFAHECNGSGRLTDHERKFLTKGTTEDYEQVMKLVEAAGRDMPQLIVQQLGLTSCKNTIVGDAMHRGVSGGQRKRVTTGEMLFGLKNVLIMDEISTGLDSASTFDIIKTQRSAAKALRKTIVISLLQPSPEVFDLFDDVVVLNEGEVLYHGPREEVVQYFRLLGLICPPRRDVADFLMDLGTPGQTQYHEPGRTGIPIEPKQLGDAFKQSSIYQTSLANVGAPLQNNLVQDMSDYFDQRGAFKQTFFENLKTLLRREWRVASRNTAFLRGRVIMVIVMGLLNGSVFYQFKPTQVQVVMGTMFGAVMFLSLGQLSEIPTFFAGRDVFYKQRGANFLRSSTYVLSFLASKIPTSIAETIVFGTLVYWMCGFVHDAGAFIRFEVLLFLTNMTFSAFFFFMASICPDVHIAKPLSILSVGIFVIFAGFIVSKAKLPDYFVWVYWLDPIAWCIRALAVNQFRNSKFEVCVYEGIDYCKLSKKASMGVYYLDLFGVPSEKKWLDLAYVFLIGLCSLFMSAAALALEYKRYEHQHSGGSQTVTSTDVNDQIEKITSIATSRVSPSQREMQQQGSAKAYTVPPVTLAFKNLWYSVPDPAKKKKGDMIDLLKGVTGYAAPGTMTALMGSSGAGKTTLMDVIAGRKTGGKIRGQILLNGHEVTKQVIQRCTGYCEQMDIHCESATVREALTFSAFLRQPAEVKDKRKLETVEECLSLLDLHPIANQKIHGRSTEQLKRITIAVELAAKPSVLFLDEPTSGLDARSAKAIMGGVRKVANSGRTIVCTIHQPSTEIFTLFDRLLLLKTGGLTVFHGSLGPDCSNLIQYFEAVRGVTKIQPSYNPATWMLECIGAGVGNTAGQQTDFAVVFAESDLKKDMEFEMARSGVSSPLADSKPFTFSKRYAATQSTQMRFVVTRFLRMYWRTPSYTQTALVMAIILALLFGGIFVNSEYNSYLGITSGVGMIFVSSLFLSIVSFNSAIPLASEERASYYREQASQMYHPFWYFVGSTVAEIPFVFSRTLVFSVIFYPLVGFTDFGSGVLFWIHLLLLVLLMTYFGQLLAYALPSMETAMLAGTLINGITNMFMGFNPPAQSIPKGYKWLYWIVPQRYALSNLVALVFADCPDGETASTSQALGCQLLQHAPVGMETLTVKQFVELVFDMKHKSINSFIIVLLACIVVFRLMAYLALRYLNHQNR